LDIPAYLSYALKLLLTPNGIAAAAGVAGLVWLWRFYRKKMEIPGLDVETIPSDTWFVNRDDDRRLCMVVSLRLANRSGQEIRVSSARFSGYSPRKDVRPILLEGRQVSLPLPFPQYDHYYRGGQYSIPPFTTRTVWFCYERGSAELRNQLDAPLVLRDANGRRTSVRVTLYRHPYQAQLYKEHLL
jgi:hypothetical protein